MVCVVILVLFGFIDNIVVDIGLIVIFGLILGINNVLFIIIVMEYLLYVRSVISGVYNFVCWLGVVFVLFCFGLFSEVFGMKMLFIVVSVICLVGMGLLFIKLKLLYFIL